MQLLRTPDDRFTSLPDFPFSPNYVDVEGIRVHYLDEGEGPVVLLLHGEPTWSFLYRKMIPVLADAGLRAVAPDLVGFGRSDKPTPRTEYTYGAHVRWMRGFLEALSLEDLTLFCQDWGGLIGLRLVAEHPDRFARVMASNTGLPTGDQGASEAFLNWRKFSQDAPELPVGAIVAAGCSAAKLSPEEVSAYDAPFPDESYKEGARQFPVLVPVSPDDPASADNRRAWESLERFDRPFLCAFGDSDPITAGADAVMKERIPGARSREHVTVAGAGHFVQEDKGPQVARILADFVRST